MSWLLHKELRQLVSPLFVYLNYVFSIVAAYPAKSKVPIAFFIAEDFRLVFKGRRLFVPNYVSPSVDLNCSSSVIFVWSNDKVDKVVFLKQSDILGCKIITIHKKKLV